MKNLVRMKILIVDDDPAIQKLIKNMLAKDGYKNIQMPVPEKRRWR